MLKTVVLLNIFIMNLFSGLINRKFKFDFKNIFLLIINVFTVTFDQYKASLLNKNCFTY